MCRLFGHRDTELDQVWKLQVWYNFLGDPSGYRVRLRVFLANCVLDIGNDELLEAVIACDDVFPCG